MILSILFHLTAAVALLLLDPPLPLLLHRLYK